jgi:hypothetical protein
MRVWTTLSLAGLIFALAGLSPSDLVLSGARAEDKPKDLIVGKWEGQGNIKGTTAEFKADGAYLSGKDKGSYKMSEDGKSIKMEWKSDAGDASYEGDIKKLTKDELVLAHKITGKEIKYKRAK